MKKQAIFFACAQIRTTFSFTDTFLTRCFSGSSSIRISIVTIAFENFLNVVYLCSVFRLTESRSDNAI